MHVCIHAHTHIYISGNYQKFIVVLSLVIHISIRTITILIFMQIHCPLDHWRDHDVDGRIILRRIFRK
jgi:hypothetical protein